MPEEDLTLYDAVTAPEPRAPDPPPLRRPLPPEKALARKKLNDWLERLAISAVKDVRGLFKDKGAPGYNPEQVMPWKEASVRTRASLEIYKQIMAERRGNVAAAAQLGVVTIQERMRREEWEATAQAVDAIDVEATEK